MRRCGPSHRATADALADSGLPSTGEMTFRIDKLENEGLVRRVHSDENRRLVLVELTEAGLATIDGVYAEHITLQQRMLEGLSPQERDQLTTLLGKLVHSVRRLPAGSEPRGH